MIYCIGNGYFSPKALSPNGGRLKYFHPGMVGKELYTGYRPFKGA
jgi:hypothetical protein